MQPNPDPDLQRTASEPAPALARPAWTRLLDALALTLLVVAGAHEAMIWLGAEGWLARLPRAGGDRSGVVIGIVFACAAAYGVYLVVRSWRRVG